MAFEHHDFLGFFVAAEHRQIWMGPICMAHIAVRFVYFLFLSCVHGCRRIGKKVCLHHSQTPSFEPHSTYKILSIRQKRKPKMHSTGFLWRFFLLLLLWVCVCAIIAKQAKLNQFFLLGQLVIVFSAIKHKYTHNIQMAVLVSCNAHSPIIKTENLSDCCFSSYHNSNEAVRYRVVFCARLLELKTPIQTRMTHIFFIAVYIAYEPRIMRANRIHRLSHWQTILVASAFLFFHSVFI